MPELFSNTTLTVLQLIEKIDTGELGLPELQRPFIWKDSKIRDLFDSMLKGYPIGYLMLWESAIESKNRTIGTISHNYTNPKEVIIDGQQRLTSLYAVIKEKPVLNAKFEEKNVIISYNPLLNKFEVGYQATKQDPEWMYNISELFNNNNFFKLINEFIEKLKKSKETKGVGLSEKDEELIQNRFMEVRNLTNYSLPVFNIKANAEEESVSDIFVRVNSGGVALKQNDFILTLLSLYWEEGRKKIETFCKNSLINTPGSTTAYNSITPVSAQDIIRVVMAYAFDRARLQYGYKLLHGADFEKRGTIDETLRIQRFETLKAKLPDVLDLHSWHEFIKAIMNAGYLSGELISSNNAVFYSYALYLIAKHRFNASNNENLHLTSLWFFYASLVALYSGSFESTVESHLNTIKTLHSFNEYRNFILSRINEELTNDFFDITLVGSKGLAVSGSGNNAWNAYVASLNILKNKILFSKSNLLVAQLFTDSCHSKRKSLEKHHLFPKNYLKQMGYSKKEINQMANYAYIDWKDNDYIGDDSPAIYYPPLCTNKPEQEIKLEEENNALPHGWEKMSYDIFLQERRKLMAQKIKQAFEQLKAAV